ncbi:hypothetical protein [Paraburkholderia dinghuensis]|uniref:Uncharacterized protein n=1 Tax=Paraburkholderia dinghuensis TaxID=2305225 RepID=A0A3N6NET5_9BURK|nr:hypothetical protein [Paraburkholderia dinghuensis]RQH07542.1 hypothetical protein D1Y85_09210 [Paraburkholderia dinghuensis]
MNDPHKKNPVFGVGVFIVVVVLLVIGTVLFNAVRDKREYEEATQPQPASEAASEAVSHASGAAQ